MKVGTELVVKALVTGATGFVGSHLAERLLQAGLHVICPVRRASRLAWIEPLPVERPALDWEDDSALSRCLAGVDYVFHVAGLTRARSREPYFEANVELTRRLAEAARRSAPNLRRFVYVSSLAAVGPNPGPAPVDEQTPPHPTSFYGESKLAAEQILLTLKDRLPLTIVRPPAVYGPRDTNFLPVLRTAQARRIVPVIGGLDKPISLVHVSDLVSGIWLAASSDQGVGQTYFLSGGIHTYGEFVSGLETALGIGLWRLRVPGWAARLVGEIGEVVWMLTGRPQIVSRRKVQDMLATRWTCSDAKAQNDIGYHHSVSLSDGLHSTAEWYAKNRWIQPSVRGGNKA